MKRAYKTELRPTAEQARKIRQGVGVCRWLYNEYIATNMARHEQGLPFMSAYDFDKHINHDVKTQEAYAWIDECGAKARKKAMQNAEAAYKRFFAGKAGFPKFKKRGRQSVSLYFPKNNKGDWTIARNMAQVPTIGKVHLKECGYLPAGAKVISGTVSQQADRYFVSVLLDVPEARCAKPTGEGIGIDLGLKDFATLSNGEVFGNINKSAKARKLKKKLKRTQRRLSRQLENKKKRGSETPAAHSANIEKRILEAQKLNLRLNNLRRDFLHRVVAAITEREPSFVTVEDLNVRGMMKNRHLARAIGESNFYTFSLLLKSKCRARGIEYRVVDRFYPSSKTCHECGYVKRGLKLSERTYKCPQCGNVIGRDLQAAMNLRDCKEYTIAA